MKAKDVTRLLRYHGLMTRLAGDPRFRRGGMGDVYRLAQVIAWERYCVPPPPAGTKDPFWARVAAEFGPRGGQYVRWALQDDVPRYAPAEASAGRCGAPMIRRDGTCGRTSALTTFTRWDPADGTGTVYAYCSQERHRHWGREQQAGQAALRKAGALPEPVPNTGGLLPCYFPDKAYHWARVYEWAMQRPWQPPAAGLRADRWPGAAPAAPRRLQVLAGAGGDSDPGAQPRWLTVVPDSG